MDSQDEGRGPFQERSREQGVRGAVLSLIKTSSGVTNMILMLCWDIFVCRRDFMLGSIVEWREWDQDIAGGPWRESKSV